MLDLDIHNRKPTSGIIKMMVSGIDPFISACPCLEYRDQTLKINDPQVSTSYHIFRQESRIKLQSAGAGHLQVTRALSLNTGNPLGKTGSLKSLDIRSSRHRGFRSHSNMRELECAGVDLDLGLPKTGVGVTADICPGDCFKSLNGAESIDYQAQITHLNSSAQLSSPDGGSSMHSTIDRSSSNHTSLNLQSYSPPLLFMGPESPGHQNSFINSSPTDP